MMKMFPEKSVKAIGAAVLRVIVLTYFLFGIVLYVRQDAMLLFPSNTPFANCPELALALQVDMNGTRGYFFQNGTSTKLAVLYHGNGDRACDRAYYRTAIEHAGYSWLIVEYTGYAGDGKSPSIGSILRDASQVDMWVRQQHVTELAIIGESIGSGPASYHSSLAPSSSLILIAPLDTLRLRAGEVYMVHPVGLMLKTDLDNISWAKTARRVLVIHSTGDSTIPFTHGKHLFDSLPQKNKLLIPLSVVDHNETPESLAAQLGIFRFLKNDDVVVF